MSVYKHHEIITQIDEESSSVVVAVYEANGTPHWFKTWKEGEAFIDTIVIKTKKEQGNMSSHKGYEIITQTDDDEKMIVVVYEPDGKPHTFKKWKDGIDYIDSVVPEYSRTSKPTQDESS